MYAIKDETSGRYLSKRSVLIEDDVCYYTTYSGQYGTDFFASRERAAGILSDFQTIISKMLAIVEIDPDKLAWGNALTVKIPLGALIVV